MRTFHPACLLLFLLLLSTTRGYSQAKEITIRFIGNCGLHLTDGRSDLYVDFPYRSGAHNYMEYDTSEIAAVPSDAILVFTHSHADHYSKKLAKRVSKQVYGPWNVEKLVQLEGQLEQFSIQAFKTKHKFSFNHYSYLITWHGKRIYISGDTEHAETIATQKDLDWAFIPAWLLVEAQRKEIHVNTKMIGMYHIGQKDNITTSTPEKILLLMQTGQTVTLPF